MNDHLYLVPKYFHYPKRNPVLTKKSFLIFPYLPLVTTNLLSVSMGLPVLGFIYKLNHTICDPLCLTSFT